MSRSDINSIQRKTGSTEAVIIWPITRMEWAGLPATVRERVRDLMDEAVDLIELHSQGDVGAEYLKTVTKPRVLTPEDEDKIAGLLACCHEWKASRVDTVHESVPVRHVCNERKGHRGEHVCSCGAFAG